MKKDSSNDKSLFNVIEVLRLFEACFVYLSHLENKLSISFLPQSICFDFRHLEIVISLN